MLEQQSRLSKVFGSKPVAQSSNAAGLKKSASQSPQTQPQQVKQITIQLPSISLRIDEHFKAKLPFLLLCLLLFAFSLVLFEKSNFHTIDVVDVGRLQYNVSKLWSVSFLLFLLLYSFAVALAMFYGFGQNWSSAFLVGVPALVIALALSVFYSSGYLLGFAAFALTLSAACFIAALRTQVKFSSIYSTAGSAVLVLVVLSFFIAFNQISANKDAYIDTFISSGVTTSVAQMQGASLGSVLSPELIRASVNKQQIESVITEQRVAQWFEGVTAFSALNASVRNATIAAVRSKLVADLHSKIQEDLPILLANVRLGGATQQSGVGVAAVKQALGQTPAFVAFYNNFALLMSVFIASIVAVFAFVIKLVATLLCWLLAKL
ncbi:MAG: hypothetical protein QW343_03610 [Candidatus Norongarragalinales archaeon]